MKLDIFSDPICPWCYIGKSYLDRALEKEGNHSSPKKALVAPNIRHLALHMKEEVDKQFVLFSLLKEMEEIDNNRRF